LERSFRSSIYTLERAEFDMGGTIFIGVTPERRPRQDHYISDFLAVVRGTIAAGNLVLISRRSQVPTAEHDWGQFLGESLVDSIGNCSGLSLAPNPGPLDYNHIQLPMILGQDETVRYVYIAGLSEESEEGSREIYRSVRIITDFKDFQHLWKNVDDNEWEDVILSRSMWDHEITKAFGAGRVLGKLHGRVHGLHGDTHLENFVYYPGVIDAEGIGDDIRGIDWGEARLLLRPPTIEECATDMVGLLARAEPAQWRAFRLGYVEVRRVEGLKVIALIQLGKDYYRYAAGWTLPTGNEGWGSNIGIDNERALILLDQAIAARPDVPREERYVKIVVRCKLLYELGRLDEGMAEAQNALKLAASISDLEFAKLGIAIADWQLNSFNADAAASVMQRVLDLDRLPDYLFDRADKILREIQDRRLD
jgi:hypothetical protein